MPKLYLLAPLVALLVFSGFYWHHHRQHITRVAAQRQAAELEREARRRAEAAARDQAMTAARIAAAQRLQEREARERTDAERKQARADAETRRTLAAAAERKLQLRLEQLRNELAAVDAAVRRAAERKHELQQENVFLARYVEAAEENRATVTQLLHQLERVEHTPPPRAPALPAITPSRS